MSDASSLFSSPDLSWHPCRLSLLLSLLVLEQLSPLPLQVPQAELLQVLQEALQEVLQVVRRAFLGRLRVGLEHRHLWCAAYPSSIDVFRREPLLP